MPVMIFLFTDGSDVKWKSSHFKMLTVIVEIKVASFEWYKILYIDSFAKWV